jgi:hypothetical protein
MIKVNCCLKRENKPSSGRKVIFKMIIGLLYPLGFYNDFKIMFINIIPLVNSIQLPKPFINLTKFFLLN